MQLSAAISISEIEWNPSHVLDPKNQAFGGPRVQIWLEQPAAEKDEPLALNQKHGL